MVKVAILVKTSIETLYTKTVNIQYNPLVKMISFIPGGWAIHVLGWGGAGWCEAAGVEELQTSGGGGGGGDHSQSQSVQWGET